MWWRALECAPKRWSPRVAPTRRPCMRQRLEGRRIWAAAGAAQQEPLLLRLLHEQLLRREDLHACRCLPCSRSAAASHQRWMPQCACGAERAAGRQTGARDGMNRPSGGFAARARRRTCRDDRRHCDAQHAGRLPTTAVSPRGRAGRLQLAARLGPDRFQSAFRAIPAGAEAAAILTDRLRFWPSESAR